MIYVNDIELMDANGHCLDECVQSYLDGKVNASRSDHPLTKDMPVYAIDLTEEQVNAELTAAGHSEIFFSLAARLALLSASKVVSRNQLTNNTAVICVTLEGSQHSKMAVSEAFFNNKRRVSSKIAASCTPSAICTYVSRNLKFTGPSLVINQACTAFVTGLDYAKYLLESNTVDNVLLIGVETSSFAPNLYIFNSLGVQTNDQIKPFDNQRSGMVLGDAAVTWLLSKNKTSQSMAQISKTSIYNDHYHLTSHNPDGSAVKFLLDNLMTAPVDSISCHGTGTVVGDKIEMHGLNQFLKIPTKLYCLKSFTGHTMASCAGVEMSYGIMGMHQDWIPYTALTTDPIDTGIHSLVLHQPLKQVNNNFIKLSFGFGGVTGGVLVEKVNS